MLGRHPNHPGWRPPPSDGAPPVNKTLSPCLSKALWLSSPIQKGISPNSDMGKLGTGEHSLCKALECLDSRAGKCPGHHLGTFPAPASGGRSHSASSHQALARWVLEWRHQHGPLGAPASSQAASHGVPGHGPQTCWITPNQTQQFCPLHMAWRVQWRNGVGQGGWCWARGAAQPRRTTQRGQPNQQQNR